MDDKIKDTEFGILVSEFLTLETNPQINDFYIDVDLKNTFGKTVSLSDFTGTFTLIDFWASWCLPCRTENPNLIELYKKYHKNGFNIIGVSMDSDKSKWLKAIKDDDLPWENLIDRVGPQSNNIFFLYDVKYIPDNLLLNQDGKIIGRNIRGNDLKQKLDTLYDF